MDESDQPTVDKVAKMDEEQKITKMVHIEYCSRNGTVRETEHF